MTVSIAADLFATHTTKLKPMNLPANTNQSAWLKLKILFVLATCLGLPATTGLQAAAITWGAPTVIAADADVATTGTALYAYAGGLATASTNLNGVTFTQGSGFAAWGNVSFTAGFTASSATAFVVNAAPFNGLSGTYSNVLQGAAYVGTTAAGTVTLNGLTAGKSYAVQIWVNDPRSAGSGRAENASSTGGNTVTLDYNNFDAPGGVGQFVYGTFVADNTNQAFTLTPNPSTGGAAQLNAISVRDLGSSTKTWLGSGGTSWGTSANWSPSVVPIPGNTVLFNNTSVANLSTLLDVNYTLAALIVSNASPISIGSANTLTLNSGSGITLVGSSQSLTISAPIVLGASQYWTLTNNSTVVASGGISGSGSFALNGGFGVTNNGGTVTFDGPQTFTGNCDVNSGKLVLTGAASLATPSLRVNSGSTLDFSAVSPTFTLNSGQVLTGFGTLGSVLNGSIDCSAGTLALRYDGVTPMFYLTNGTMTLSGGTVLSVNNIGSTLIAGTYNIISAATSGNVGSVTGTLPSVTLTGNGAVGAVSIQFSGSGDLQLVVAPADVWTGATDTSWVTAGNWNPAVSPNIGDYVLFNNSSTANLATVLNADFFLTGLSVINPTGPVSISGANTLGTSAAGINLAGASQNLTISAPLQVLADQSWIVTNARTLTISGGVSGSGSVIVSGGGKVALNSVATHTGNTTVAAGSTLQTTAANVLPNGAGPGNVIVNGTLDLNGNSQAVNGFSGSSSGVVDNTAGSATTLAIGSNGVAGTFNGIIQNTGGALALDVLAGNLTLIASNNTYSGGTTFESGAFLSFPSATAKYGTGPVIFKPGANSYTSATTFTNVLSLDSCYLRVGGGNLNVQNWSGPITITNGLQLSGDSGAGGVTLSGPINIGTGGISITNSINNGGNQGFGVSTTGDLLSGVISGSGGITYYCNGSTSRLTVQGANTYSGSTVVNGTGNGKLNVWNASNPFSTGTVTLNAGAIIEAAPGNGTVTNALILNGGILESEAQFNNYNTLTWAGPITVTADSSLVQFAVGALNNNQSAGVNVSGPLNLNGFTLTCSSPVDAFSGSTISGSISGAGNIIYNSFANNTLTISGSNTFSGTFRSAGAGKLSIGNVYALQKATLDMNAADLGTVTFNNLNAVIGALTGSRNLALGSSVMSIGNNNANTTYSGVLSGIGSVTKIGSGTVILSGANNYTGNTTVSGGTLDIQQHNFALSSTVTVAGGAFLQLDTAITNIVTALVLNGVGQPNGVYKSANSGGRITGTGSIQVGITPEIWTGAFSSEWSANILTAPKNWKYNAVQADYTNGNAVLFDDTLTLNSNVNLSVANVTPTIVTFNNTNINYTLQGSALITGSAFLNKNGAGTVTLLNSNLFTGNVNINGGRLAIGGNGYLGAGRSYAGPIAMANGATFEYSGTNSAGQTLSGPITGAGSLLLDSTNTSTLTLSAGANANNYSGITTISNANNVSLRLTAATPAAISANTTLNIVGAATGGQLLVNGTGTVPNNFNLSGFGWAETGGNGGAVSGAIRLGTSQTLTGTINLTGNSRIGCFVTANQTETISGQITGNFSMDFLGFFNVASTTNSFILANTGAANNYTGNTTLYNLYYNNSSAGNNAILRLGASEQIPNGIGRGALVLAGSSANRLCTFELNGFSETVNGITNTTAGAFSVIQNTTTGASVLTVGDGNATSIFSGNIVDGGAGKTLAVTKIGSGTLTVSGTNTYLGNTTISGGTLIVSTTTNGTGTGTVNINSGGTLGGIGTIVGLVNNNASGILSPGVGGVGRLTLNGNVTLLSGSTNAFLVNGTTATNNSVIVGAAVTYGGVLNIVTNGIFTVGQKFTLFNGTGATNTSSFASVVGSPGTGMLFSFTNGVLSVIASGPLPPAVINSVSVSGSNLILQGTNGAPSGTYSILTSTNLALPLANWTTNNSGTFTAGGAFSNGISITTQPQRFFLIKQP